MRRLVLLFSFFSMVCTAQENAVITGTIRNALAPNVELIVNQEYLDNTTTTYATRLINENQFSFNFPLSRSHKVLIKYARNYAEVYAEPGDSIHIDFDANSFQYTMKFSGKGGKNNIFYQNFKRQFPEETNKFRLIGFRKGIVHYEVEEKVNRHMLYLTEGNYSGTMEKERTEKVLEMDMYDTNEGGLTPGFKSYLWSEIYYDWAYKMLVYGYLYPRKVSPDFWTFLDEVPIENESAISNPKYRKYLIGYLNYLYFKSDSDSDPYVGQYELAKTKLADKSLFFFQSHLLDQAFRKGEFIDVLDTYNEFLLANPYEEFDQKAIDAYYFANKYAVGSPAPEFDLTDLNGNPLRLSDLRGKFVYLDFWATWCRPCITKLEMVKDIERTLDPEKIVFVHLSLERSESRWRDQVNFRNISGVHGFLAEGLESPVIVNYNIGAIPEYFIIDPNGNFAEKATKNDRFNVQNHLKELMVGW